MKKYGKVTKGALVIIIIVCILVVGIVAAIGVYSFDKQNKEKQEKILDDVATSMHTSTNFDKEIKTTGNFAKVEKALKEYYIEYINTSSDLVSIYSKNLLGNSLTASNISSDGPEFTKSKENIKNIKAVSYTHLTLPTIA